jgi:hypothetical protein
MLTHGPSGVPSRPGVRLGDEVIRLRRSQIAAHNTNAYRRRVAAKGACGGAQPVTRPRGPPVGNITAPPSVPTRPGRGAALASAICLAIAQAPAPTPPATATSRDVQVGS